MAETLLYQGVAVNPANGMRLRLGFNSETLAGAKTLTPQDAQVQLLHTGGAHTRVINLPAVGASQGLVFFIKHTHSAGQLDVTDPSAGMTTVSLTTGEWSIFTCDGTNWSSMGVLTHA